jgi:hypothetical protein
MVAATSDWLHNLPILWVTIVILGANYLLAAAIYFIVAALTREERIPAFKAVAPGLLSPLGTIFGLFVVFTAVQVWNDNDHADAAVDREASSLKSVIVLADSLREGPRERLRVLVSSYIKDEITQEWPAMARHDATLTMTPQYLAQGLKLVLGLTPGSPGETIAQREIATALENAFEARRERILVSRARVSFFKWACLLVQALCIFVMIRLIHCDKRLTSGIALGLFATGVGACLVLIVAYDGPFDGEFAIRPEPLLQVLQESSRSTAPASPVMPLSQ